MTKFFSLWFIVCTSDISKALQSVCVRGGGVSGPLIIITFIICKTMNESTPKKKKKVNEKDIIKEDSKEEAIQISL